MLDNVKSNVLNSAILYLHGLKGYAVSKIINSRYA